MPTDRQWITFLVASFLFIQVPGPSLLFAIGRALTVGRRDALLSVVGNAVGMIAQAALLAVGLGTLVATSATAFTVVKFIGAAYVIYLGVQAIRHRKDASLAMTTTQPTTRDQHPVRTGFTVGATNPKTMVFFAAFLPQFVDPSRGHAVLWTVLLGVVFGVMAVLSDSVWTLMAAQARLWFAKRPQRLDHLSTAGGAMMIALGVTLASASAE